MPDACEAFDIVADHSVVDAIEAETVIVDGDDAHEVAVEVDFDADKLVVFEVDNSDILVSKSSVL